MKRQQNVSTERSILEQRFQKLTKDLNIPDGRRAVNEQNLRWFLRNGAIQNMNHQNCYDAIDVAKTILREQTY
jgi:hypothetical protein